MSWVSLWARQKCKDFPGKAWILAPRLPWARYATDSGKADSGKRIPERRIPENGFRMTDSGNDGFRKRRIPENGFRKRRIPETTDSRNNGFRKQRIPETTDSRTHGFQNQRFPATLNPKKWFPRPQNLKRYSPDPKP